ncbi:hypothetical protein NSA56_11355 [Oceanobacillus caeni]|uniref:hypothetical protein n=1 Tax=Oceanobacillus caeni TaxID=405946 RepID=UPI002149FB95|nr:hypothetical protein [Oceanobacillus caeni]MCR1834992.1 hypothetical protein [Oceanobacillus caeni]
MTDKERLEEIKSRVWKDKGTYAMGDYSQREGYIYTLSDYDYEWLIEQAERVQEVEEELKELRAMYSVVNGERIRYKQALEFYADEENWTEPSRQQVMMDGEPDTVDGPPWAIEDSGEKARQVLEGDKP